MMHLLNSRFGLDLRKPAKDLFGFIFKDNVAGSVRTHKTYRLSFQPGSWRGKYTENFIVKNNVRYNTDKKHDRFIPKDPLEGKSLWKPMLFTIVIGGTGAAIFYYVKKKKLELIEKNRNKSLGKAAIGGAFELSDSDNNIHTDKEFLGKWLLIYFGFTHCPDICPDEMEKLVKVVNMIEKDESVPNVVPIFITVDPERDTPAVVGKYVKEFSDKILGLSGTIEQVKDVLKKYRVYYSAGPKDEDSDYIVDHSIVTYLMNPEGELMDFYGLTSDAEKMYRSYKFNVLKYEVPRRKNVFQKYILGG